MRKMKFLCTVGHSWQSFPPDKHLQIAGQRGLIHARIFLQQRALHLPGAVEHCAAVPATLSEHRGNLPRRSEISSFFFGGAVWSGASRRFHPLVFSAIPSEVVREPDGVIPMRSKSRPSPTEWKDRPGIYPKTTFFFLLWCFSSWRNVCWCQ